ncbi:MAG: hypothetical protein ACI83I_000571 [Bacteroidia bacterium]|jgi:hypothetical protein
MQTMVLGLFGLVLVLVWFGYGYGYEGLTSNR